LIYRLPDGDLERFIDEDIPYGDLTTYLLVAQAGVGIVQIEKMSPQELSLLIRQIRQIAPAMGVSAAGGINETNVADYAATGVDILVFSSEYFGKPTDIDVRIVPKT